MTDPVAKQEPLQAGGCVAGRYEIVRLLGVGALSRTYLARAAHSPGTSYVVLRQFCLPLHAGDDPQGAAEYVLRELQRVVALRHRSLPCLQECFLWEGDPWTARTHVDGHALPRALECGQAPIAEVLARAWALQLAEALAVLHAQVPPFTVAGLSPAHVLVSPVGRAVLLDYPVPCFLPPDLQWRYARQVAQGFLAPEVQRGESRAPTADVFALGALLLHVLAHATPAASRLVPRTVADRRTDVEASTWAIVERALAAEPSARFQDAQAMAEALRTSAAPVPPFEVEPRAVRLLLKHGELARRHVRLVAREGELYGHARSDSPWLRPRFDAFRGDEVEMDFTVDTQDMPPGTVATGILHMDTQCGQVEVEVVVEVEARLGERLTRGVRSWLGGS